MLRIAQFSLRDIFFEAVDQDYLRKDPARKVEVTKQLRESDKTTLNCEQLRQVLAALPLRDRVLLELDMTKCFVSQRTVRLALEALQL